MTARWARLPRAATVTVARMRRPRRATPSDVTWTGAVSSATGLAANGAEATGSVVLAPGAALAAGASGEAAWRAAPGVSPLGACWTTGATTGADSQLVTVSTGSVSA